MYTTGRTLPITEEELHYELNDAGVLRVAKVEIESMKAAGTYTGLMLEIEDIGPVSATLNTNEADGRYRLVLRVLSSYAPKTVEEIAAGGERTSTIHVAKVPHDIALVQALIDREIKLSQLIENELGERVRCDYLKWQMLVDTAARDKTKPKKNITEFVYSYGEKYYAAYCPNEKAAELKKALADIFGTEPEEYKK